MPCSFVTCIVGDDGLEVKPFFMLCMDVSSCSSFSRTAPNLLAVLSTLGRGQQMHLNRFPKEKP